MADNRSIGLFDSGVGGTSIWNEIHLLLPLESTIYLADSKNAPYGPKSKEEILALSKKNTEILLGEGCKLIVVACNTATTNAIKELRETYPIPFIGIEPAIKPAALQSKTNSIGVLATKGTLSSDLFHKAVEAYSEVKIVEQIGHGLVQLIEDGKADSAEAEHLLRTYLQPMIEENIDHLVLGCSHYPYLIPLIRKILPSDIRIIDSGEAVARQTKAVLEKHHALADQQLQQPLFYSNSDSTVLKQLLNHRYTVLEKNF
mgnify:CR=1 FL=1